MDRIKTMPSIKNIRDGGRAGPDLSWSAEERLRFVEAAAFWDGRINRGDLIGAFGISVPQATIDLKRYQEVAPGNLRYDPREKSYLSEERFTPHFGVPDAEAWLSGLVPMGRTGDGGLTVEAVPGPARALDPWLVRRVVTAARKGRALQVLYQSMEQAEPAWWWIVPRAIVTNGERWHLRAYNRDRGRHEDLLFPRVLQIGADEPADPEMPEDIDWLRMVTVQLRPARRLSPSQRAVIARDYGMADDTAALQVRAAQLFLFLRRIGVDRAGALIEVVNRADVEAELARQRAAFTPSAAEA